MASPEIKAILEEGKCVILDQGWGNDTRAGINPYEAIKVAASRLKTGGWAMAYMWFRQATKRPVFKMDGVEWESIIQWNNQPDRTQEDVLKAFDIAIEIASAYP